MSKIEVLQINIGSTHQEDGVFIIFKYPVKSIKTCVRERLIVSKQIIIIA